MATSIRPTVKLSYDKAGELYSVKIRVSYQREQKRYGFPVPGGILIRPVDFDRLIQYHQTRSARTAEEIRSLHALLLTYLSRAEAVANSLQPFSFERFKTLFYSEENAPADPNAPELLSDLASLERQHTESGQLSYADEFANARKSLTRFMVVREGGPRLPYEQVTPDFLLSYERWMLTEGKQHRGKRAGGKAAEGVSITTVGIYLRAVRKAVLWAIERKLLPKEAYPFGKGKYIIPTGRNIKKALTKADVQKLINAELPPEPYYQKARDIWVFSYLTNGMNVTDICHLQWKHIDLVSGKIEYVREKTARTGRGEQVKISASLFPESRAIVERQRTKDPKSPYVFPFFRPGLSAHQEKGIVRDLVKYTNRYMRRIAASIGITANVTTYTARHSFSTILLRSKVPVAFISQKLGHKTIKTTENYLGSFEGEQEEEFLSHLL